LEEAMEHQVTLETKVDSNVSIDAKVRRGPVSWAFIYMTLGFALAIESTVMPMLFDFPWNIILYIAVGAFTFWLFIGNGQFQNWLIKLKKSYEDRLR
jgi:hypothetical protein